MIHNNDTYGNEAIREALAAGGRACVRLGDGRRREYPPRDRPQRRLDDE